MMLQHKIFSSMSFSLPFLDISSGVSPFLRLTPYRSIARTKLTESFSNAAIDAVSNDYSHNPWQIEVNKSS